MGSIPTQGNYIGEITYIDYFLKLPDKPQNKDNIENIM